MQSQLLCHSHAGSGPRKCGLLYFVSLCDSLSTSFRLRRFAARFGARARVSIRLRAWRSRIRSHFIRSRNIKSRNIKNRNIKSRNIQSRNMKSRNMKSRNIKSHCCCCCCRAPAVSRNGHRAANAEQEECVASWAARRSTARPAPSERTCRDIAEIQPRYSRDVAEM